MKKMWSRNWQNIVILFCIVLIAVLLYLFNDIQIKYNTDESTNLMTINSVFAGFVYSMLGNILELSNNQKVKAYDKAGYLSKYYGSVYLALFFLILSIFVSMALTFFGLFTNSNIFLYLEKFFSITGILFFSISALRIFSLINWLRKY